MLCVSYFDHEPPAIELPVVNGEWSYAWNTSGRSLGTHLITVTSRENISDEKSILLIDGLPPSLSIDTPVDGAILEHGILNISGHSSDNLGVDHVEVTLITSPDKRLAQQHGISPGISLDFPLVIISSR